MKVYEYEFNDAVILRMQVGTTGLKGGDAGHGGKTKFRIDGTGLELGDVKINDKALGKFKQLEFTVLGDAELRVLAQAFQKAAEVLNAALLDKHGDLVGVFEEE